MDPVTVTVLLQTPTPPPTGVGPAELTDYLPSLVRVGWFLAAAILVVVLGWYVVDPAINRAIRRRNEDNPTLQEAISRYVRLLVVVVAVFVGAGVAGYGRFLASSALVVAAGTLAVGVAGQAVLGSLISGLVLVVDPEFNIGNYIEWADGEGEVQSITLRVTRVRTPDGDLVTIPNTLLTEQSITRPYGHQRRRIVERIGLAYEDDIETACGIMEAVATDLDGVLDDPAPAAYVEDLGSDAVVVRVHYWVDDPRRRDVLRVRSRFARAAKDRLEAADITISPPSKRDLEGRIEVAEAA